MTKTYYIVAKLDQIQGLELSNLFERIGDAHRYAQSFGGYVREVRVCPTGIEPVSPASQASDLSVDRRARKI